MKNTPAVSALLTATALTACGSMSTSSPVPVATVTVVQTVSASPSIIAPSATPTASSEEPSPSVSPASDSPNVPPSASTVSDSPSVAPSQSTNYDRLSLPQQIATRLQCVDFADTNADQQGADYMVYDCQLTRSGLHIFASVFGTAKEADATQYEIENAGYTVARRGLIVLHTKTPEEPKTLRLAKQRWDANECACATQLG